MGRPLLFLRPHADVAVHRNIFAKGRVIVYAFGPGAASHFKWVILAESLASLLHNGVLYGHGTNAPHVMRVRLIFVGYTGFAKEK